VELIDLSGEGKTCPTLPDYPHRAQRLTATFYNGNVIACGGDKYGTATSDCFILGPDLSTWENLGSIVPVSHNMASSIIDNKWFISGGRRSTATLQSTSVWDGSVFEDGPEMPGRKENHCQITVNSTHVFLANGYEYPETYLLDWELETYYIFEDIPNTQYLSACGLLNNVVNGLEVLVADGEYSYIFSLTNLTWRDGPKLPNNIRQPSSAPTKNGFISIGGRNDDGPVASIYKFDETIYEWGSEIAKLNIGREFAASVPVPDDYANCQ